MPPKLKTPKSSKSASPNITESISDVMPSNLTKAVNRVSNTSNKTLIESKLNDPMTKQVLSGNMSQISKQIKSNPNTINSRFKKGKSQYKDIKGFQIMKFNNPDDMVNFKNQLKDNNANIKVVKKEIKPKPQPKKLYDIVDIGTDDSDKYPLGKHHFKINVLEDGMDYNDIEQAIGDFTSNSIKKRKLQPTDWVRIMVEDPNLPLLC